MSSNDNQSPRPLRPVINVSGTMTSLGASASIVVPEAIAAMTRILSQFVEMADLQRHASQVIARLTGAEAGFITASCASGISLAVAGCMTDDDLAAIERLPQAPLDKNEVIIQAGHLVNYGAPVAQSICLTGAKVVSIGQATSAFPYHLSGAINERTAAAVYVVSHHVVEYGQIPLEVFCQVAHQYGVPVIVDAASEYDLQKFLRQGADIVLYSGHKFLGGPTSGIEAGDKQRVRSAWLQNRGIGRGMKVGKESIAGVCAALAAGAPPVIVRDHLVEHGFFYLDPCNLHDGQAQQVLARVQAELTRAQQAANWIITPFGERMLVQQAAITRWPD